MNTIYTLGYSGWKPIALKAQVDTLGARLVDIRYNPQSRRPEWRKDAFRALLGDHYTHWPSLGNRNYKTGGPIELAAPDVALGLASSVLPEFPIILMCACREVESCHRLVAATFLSERLGAPIVHLAP
ncbi:MAG: DUF488 domain-containing protein [Kouleothrix sp.]|nr:DUF488 domain-containing protein [Kouleothrix sp.]